MTGRPRLLDLFCCAGGAARGYADAGFDVLGVDVEPQPRYPFAFLRADVLALEPRFLAYFDAVHASPPCQGYTALRHAPGAKGAPRLIAPVRALLQAAGRPWVIENVEEARVELRAPVLLCGSMFGLGARGAQLLRHRLFETSFPLKPPSPCAHDQERPVVGVYGGHARIRSSRFGGRTTRDDWGTGGHKPVMSEAMGGMPWATCAEMSEAIPPAFTAHIGRQLLDHVTGQGRAAA